MSQCTCKKTNSLSNILGLGTALITPFRVDGAVDYVALERLLYKQIAGGVDYIVVLGTTGEAATLTTEEKNEVRRFVADYISDHPSPVTNKPIPLVLGLGGNCTAAVCEQVRTTDFTGYSAILSVCPYYNKPSQEGLFQHFTAIASISPIPIILRIRTYTYTRERLTPDCNRSG
jgi:4-hydroxy-tetrahydrodipicolinate synthase